MPTVPVEWRHDMSARQFTIHGLVRSFLGGFVAAVGLFAFIASRSEATPATEGQWRGGLVYMGDNAAHSALLRGPSDSFRWMWWHGHPNEPEDPQYHVWGYTPGYSFSFGPLNDYTIPQPGNAFCSGHVQLQNGHLFMAGSQDISLFEGLGTTTAYKFDPLNSLFTSLAPMGQERYYPTSTFLPTGKVLIAGGSTYEVAPSFGGRGPTGLQNDLRSMKLVPGRTWLGSYGTGPVTGAPPPAIEGHTSVMDRFHGRRVLIFGGREELSGGAYQLHDEVWSLVGDIAAETHPLEWTWSILTTDGDPALGNQKPSARYEHAAVFKGTKMYVFGGSNGTQALGDLWELDLGATPRPRWTRIYEWQSGSSGPSPRWGHSMVTANSNGQGGGAYSLTVFGGRDENQYRTDDTWAFDLGEGWIPGTSSGTPRIDHVAFALDIASSHVFPPLNRMLVFGGRAPSGEVLADTRYYYYYGGGQSIDDTWVTVSGPGPSARAGSAGFDYFDNYVSSVTIHGGVLADGNLSPESWLFSPVEGGSWTPGSTSGGPGERVNHAMAVFSVDGGGVVNLLSSRTLELYDQTGSTSGLPGTWANLPSTANRRFYLYPQMFLLPSGKVFHAGPEISTRALDVSAGTWGPVLSVATGHFNAASIQYRPGSIMRCGGPGLNGEPSTGHTETITFDANGNTAGWQMGANEMLPRVNPNLTVLPTGEVLVSGGSLGASDGGGYEKRPQLWNPTTKAWGSALPPDPGQRAYHSTMLLLPDGRLASAGGFEGYADAAHFYSIYEPYYLFDGNGAPIQQQPTITSVQAVLEYGGAFSIETANPSLVTSVCLIRPTSTTHAVNFEQSYIPLSFWRCGLGSSPIRAYAPANARIAPPGNYMLFILQKVSGPGEPLRTVPSIARWVKLPDTSADQDPPGQVTGLYAEGACMDYAILNWSAPAANGAAGTGTALEYDLRISIAGFTNESFDCDERIMLPFTPSAPGTPEQFIVTGLTCGTNYNFAIKARDGVAHWGPMSNIASAQPYCLPPNQWCADGPFAIESTDIPSHLEFSAPYPNPAVEAPWVRFGIPASLAGQKLEIKVFDAAGRQIAQLAGGPAKPGRQQLRWNLRGTRGDVVRQGVYFIRLQIGESTLTRPVITAHSATD